MESEFNFNSAKIKTKPIALVAQGENLAYQGNFDTAVEKFKKAQQLNNNIDLNPETKQLDNNPEATAAIALVAQGKKLIYKGKVKEAVASYNKALRINPKLEIPRWDFESLCWNGSLYNHTQDVMFACEKAVALAPKNGGILDIRGLARALTGDYKGAIEDFEVFVKWTNNSKLKSQRQSWINDLRNGKNPFTPEFMEELRKGQ